jgi:malonate transporter
MIEIFLKTLPFFALIALGYQACRTGFFTAEAAAYLTKFVFYFALSAMLFRFSANLSLGRSSTGGSWRPISGAVSSFTSSRPGVAILRRRPIAEAAVEAQCAVIGNTGFLGVPMLVVLLGEAAAGPVLMVLALDLIVFSTLIVILVTGSREGQVTYRTLRNVGLGLLKNPMIMSITLGLIWSSTGWTVPGPVNEFLAILGRGRDARRALRHRRLAGGQIGGAAVGRGLAELLQAGAAPAAVAFAALWLFPVDTFDAAVMIAAASLPVAGNVYILAQHYGVAPQRVSASILISTAISILTVSAVIAWVADMAGIVVGG